MPPHSPRAAWTTLKPSTAVKPTGTSATRPTRQRNAADGLTRPIPSGSSLGGDRSHDSRARLRGGIKESHTAVTKAAGSLEAPKQKTSKYVSTRPLLAPGRVVGVLDLPASRKKLRVRRLPEHPLSTEFKETTISYSDELAEAVKHALNVEHEKLVKRLRGEADGESEKLTADRMLDEAIESAANSFKPLAEEKVVVINTSESGATSHETYTLQQRVERFEKLVEVHKANIAKLSKEHDEILKQVATFVSKNLDPSLPDSLSPDSEQMQKLIKQLEHEIEELGEKELEQLRNEKEQDKLHMKKLTEILHAMD